MAGGEHHGEDAPHGVQRGPVRGASCARFTGCGPRRPARGASLSSAVLETGPREQLTADPPSCWDFLRKTLGASNETGRADGGQREPGSPASVGPERFHSWAPRPSRPRAWAAGACRASVCRARQARPGPESAARAPSSLTSRRAAQGIFPGPKECPRRLLFPVILGG